MDKAEIKEYILGSLRRSRGDNLERANHAWSGVPEDKLDDQWGQSCSTIRQLWDGYKEERADNDEAINFVKNNL